MNDLSDAFAAALALILALDGDLMEIIGLSLYVTLFALAIASVVALPMGAAVALARFPGRGAIITLLNSLMGLPPVVVGLLVYLMLSRAGPLGELGAGRLRVRCQSGSKGRLPGTYHSHTTSLGNAGPGRDSRRPDAQ